MRQSSKTPAPAAGTVPPPRRRNVAMRPPDGGRAPNAHTRPRPLGGSEWEALSDETQSELEQLVDVLKAVKAGDFSVRLPIETNDEFGVVAHGFNRMAGEIQDLYSDLEKRVDEKTRQLAAQHRDLSAARRPGRSRRCRNAKGTHHRAHARRARRSVGAFAGGARG